MTSAGARFGGEKDFAPGMPGTPPKGYIGMDIFVAS